ncbi:MULTISPECIES: HutP family protein [unclassified Dehalobacter]|uniref:HutP family protein n=1 Tax=unclassified Dehalobacter TaxID=2635733 RepID=UPI00036C3798|nr:MULTISPECIES: HutP family protein [unclassified Dehalobacter]RJE46937.1 hut operon positive regulator HutP [Dehalobacter sp. MCB1]TCX50861.1 hut operon positive regulator HutP [Dehalobacter sp. 12DCB1]TCX51573.1 hut operon positive regulator HutP [Dehalobacter sp. 14DCB1]
MVPDSKTVALAALRMAMSETREEEGALKQQFLADNIKTVAVDYGGDYLASIKKLVERAIVASKREGVIHDSHGDEGAVAGATREALSQIMPKAAGLNIGGKIGIAHRGDHLSVAVFFGVGLLHLDEVAVGLGHRVAPRS